MLIATSPFVPRQARDDIAQGDVAGGVKSDKEMP